MKRGILESLGSSSFSLTCMNISPESTSVPRCAPGALRDQKKALAPLELELGKVVSTMWMRELNPVPQEEQC